MNPDPVEVARQKWNRKHSVKLPRGITEHVEPQPKAATTPGQAGEVVAQYTIDRAENDQDMSKE